MNKIGINNIYEKERIFTVCIFCNSLVADFACRCSKWKIPAIAGTLESSDVQIAIAPNPGMGIEIALESDVKAQFGDSIRATVRDVLAEFDISEASVQLLDKGALDCVIRARLRCAICRSAEIPYDWTKEDAK